MTTIAERIQTALDIRELKQADLVRITGIGKSSISTYISGEYEPKQKNIYKIAKALDVSEAWLMGHDAPMARERPSHSDEAQCSGSLSHLTPAAQRIGRAYEVAPQPIQRTVEVALEPYMPDGTTPIKIAPSKEDAEIAAELEPDIPKLPTYTQAVAAGLGNYQDDEDYELIAYPDAPSRANIAVKISGDSMEPDYRDGDVVFVETESVLRDGEVGIFNYDSGGYIKVLRLNPLRLVSLNDKYNDIYVNQDGDIPFMTIGRVVGIAE